MNNIQVKEIKSKKEFKKFLFFPWKIYKNDPNWVPPLLADIREKLDKKKNPFFEHAEIELFMAYKNNQIVGRIAAIIDENHNQMHNEKVVFFGLYESTNDAEVACALLNKVAEWGKRRGMEILRGPMNLSMNDECAFLLEGFDSPPVVMMTYNPPYYLELMEKCGLVKARDLYAFYMTKNHDTAAKVRQIVERVRKETKVKLRTVDMKNLAEEVRKIKFIYNNAWEKNWGFVPWTEREMDFMVKKLKQFADPRLVIFAEHNGKPIGFAFGFPNYNEVIKRMKGRLTPLSILKFLIYRRKIKGMRAVVFGVLREYRLTGISYLLYSELEKNALEAGYEWCETSWQLEDNEAINRFVESLGGKIYKKYRIFEKKIV
ncbi:MAG: GNAT family N-acetyltransferase [Candidatus Aminicenantales bacterium]